MDLLECWPGAILAALTDPEWHTELMRAGTRPCGHPTRRELEGQPPAQQEEDTAPTRPAPATRARRPDNLERPLERAQSGPEPEDSGENASRGCEIDTRGRYAFSESRAYHTCVTPHASNSVNCQHQVAAVRLLPPHCSRHLQTRRPKTEWQTPFAEVSSAE